MSFEYTLDKVNKLGDNDETYGQRYWCESPEEDKPLSFNSKENIELTETSGAIQITAEERVEKQSKKGTVYYQLKKVKVTDRRSDPRVDIANEIEKKGASGSLAYGSPQGISTAQLDRIEKQLSLVLEGINDLKGNNSEEAPY
jgi:hypothetical protein